MPLEAGSVFVRLAGRFVKDDFEKYDKAVKGEREKSKHPIDIKLGADKRPLERNLIEANAMVKKWKDQREADVKLGADTSKLDAAIKLAEKYINDMRKQMQNAVKHDVDKAFAQMGQDVDRLGKNSEGSANRIRLLAPAFDAVAKAMRSVGAEGSRVEKALAAAGGGGGGGIGRGIMGALGGLPWWAKAAPVLGPGALGLAGGASALIGSLGAGALGAGALGVGAAGVGGTGLAAIMAEAKPAAADLKKVETAYGALQKAQDKYGANSKQAAAAQKSYNAVLKETDPAFGRVVKSMHNFEDHWRGATKPAMHSMATAFGDVLQAASSHMGALAKIVNTVWSGIQKAVQPVVRQLFGHEMLSIFQSLAGAFSKMLGPALKGFMNVFQAFGHIAVAMEPYLMKLVNHFEAWSHRFLDATRNTGRLNTVVGHLMSQFESWMHLLGAFGRVLVTFFGAGAAQGQTMVDKLTAILNRWNAWMKSDAGQQKLHSFFDHSVKFTEQFFAGLGQIAGLLGKVSAALLPSIVKLLQTIMPVVMGIANAFAAVVKWIVDIVKQNPLLKDMLGIIVGIGLAWKAISFLGQITGITKLIEMYRMLGTTAAATAVEERAAAEGGMMGGKGLAGKMGKGGMIGMGLGAGAMIGGSMIGGKGGGILSGAGTGAMIGSVLGPEGAAFGALAGAALSAASALKKTSDYSKGTSEALSKMGGPIHASTKDLRSLQTNLQQNINGFKAIGASVPDSLKKAKASMDALVANRDAWNKNFNQAWQAVHNFAVRSGGGIKDLKDRFDTNMRLIRSTVGLNSDAGRKLATENFNRMVSAVSKDMARGRISVHDGIDFIRKTAQNGTTQMRNVVIQRYGDITKAVISAWNRHKITAQQALQAITSITNTYHKSLDANTKAYYAQQEARARKAKDAGTLTEAQLKTELERIQRQRNENMAVNDLKTMSRLHDIMQTGTQKQRDAVRPILDGLLKDYQRRTGDMTTAANLMRGNNVADFIAVGAVIGGLPGKVSGPINLFTGKVNDAANAGKGLPGVFASASSAIDAFGGAASNTAGRIGSLISQLGNLRNQSVGNVKKALGLRGGGSVATGSAIGYRVPGRADKDATLAALAGDEVVLTGDGQRRIEARMPGVLDYVVNTQADHFPSTVAGNDEVTIPAFRRGRGGKHRHTPQHHKSTGQPKATGKTKSAGREPSLLKFTGFRLGSSVFINDDRMIAALDDKYNRQQNVFELYDAVSGSLPIEDLNVLAGIREQEWRILYGEFQDLPKYIAASNKEIASMKGNTWFYQQEVAEQKIIDSTEAQLKKDERAHARQRHQASGAAMKEANRIAALMSGLLDQRAQWQQRLIDANGIKNKGQRQSAQGDAHKHIRDIDAQIKKLNGDHSAASRHYAKEGWADAWNYQKTKWKLEDKISRAKKLHAHYKSLADAQNKEIAAATAYVQSLTDRLYGSPDGGTAPITASMADIGQDILQLATEGAQVPPSYVTQIDALLRGMGVGIPGTQTGTGAAGNVLAAAAAAMFEQFQASRSALFFGSAGTSGLGRTSGISLPANVESNFVAAGESAYGTPAALAAGTQHYGAAGTQLSGGSSTSIHIEQNFASGPPEPHLYAAGLNYELQAMR